MPIYYDIRNDINKYPDAWLYIVYSKRGPGKTYSTLRYCIEEDIKFIYMKRTIEDVRMLLAADAGKLKTDAAADFSPFVPLNRDLGWDIKAFEIDKKSGLAGFYHSAETEEGEIIPKGKCLGYIIAATAASKFKGFDMSDCLIDIYDEFIPRPWDRVNRKEGDQVLDLYLTIQRDQLKRGMPELKLICLANAANISNPLLYTMDLMDIAAEMNVTGTEYHYDDYKSYMMHQIPAEFDKEENTKKSGIERMMEGTPFGEMAFGGKFGYNDFSAIGKVQLKGYRPYCAFKFKKRTYYVYMKDGKYYICYSAYKVGKIYDLDEELVSMKFYYDYIIDLKNEAIDGNVNFESYTAYDLVLNYKKIFDIR